MKDYSSPRKKSTLKYIRTQRWFFAFLLFILPLNVLARPILPLLKINQYYLVYTDPAIPSLDKNSHFIVGLRGIAELMKGHYTVSGPTFVMTTDTHSVRFLNGCSYAVIDNKVVRMPTQAVISGRYKRLLIPIRVLIDAFHISSSWDGRRKILSLEGQFLTKALDWDDMTMLVGREERPSVSNFSLLPIKLSEHNDYPSDNTLLRHFSPGESRLHLEVKNISNIDLPGASAYINVWGGDAYGLYGINLPYPPDTDGPNPPMKSGTIRKVDIIIQTKKTYAKTSRIIDTTPYVVVWLVVSSYR